jgi:uncharacterized protein YndB with AHSA1/START domain
MERKSSHMPRKDICTSLAAERTIWIASSRERVWQAITDPKQLDVWYAPGSTWAIPLLKVGAVVTFQPASSEIMSATIDFLDPMDEFVLRWQPDKTYPEVILVTTFFLEDENGGIRMTINECGYAALPEDIRQEWVDGTNDCYGMSIENLKALVEGRSIPHTWTRPSSQP